jgi:hypothetical protein
MSELNFHNNSEDSPRIEIVIQIRDHNGNPTGKTKSYSSDKVSEASSWYDKQRQKKRKRKRKAKK